MRIGIVCYPSHGGSGAIACELAVALAAAGDEIHVLSTKCPPRLRARQPGISTLPLERDARPVEGSMQGDIYFHSMEAPGYPLFGDAPPTLAAANHIVRVAQRWHLDVIHVHYAIPYGISALLARQILAADGMRLGVVLTLHGTDVTLIGGEPTYRATTLHSLHESDAVTAVSPWLRRRALHDLGATCAIDVVGNFVDTERFRPRRRGAVPPDPGEPWRLLHVSNFRPVKRSVDAVDVLARLRRHHPAELILVGDGPDLVPVEDRARALGVSDAVHRLGLIDDIERVYRRAHLLLVTSEMESFCMAALEAMASGIPVVGTRAGGLVQLVRDGLCGFLRPAGRVGELAEAVEAVLGDRHRCLRMGRAARRQAGAYSVGSAVERYRRIYRRVQAA